MDSDDEICPKSCRMYCRNRWNFGRPKFCDAKRIKDALDGLHGAELFNMAKHLMLEKSSYVREGQYDYVLAVQRGIITNKLEAEIELIDETIETLETIEALQEIVQWPEMYPFKEYTVACLVQRFTKSRPLFLSNEVDELKMGKVDFETLIDRLGSAQLGQLGLTKEYCYSLTDASFFDRK